MIGKKAYTASEGDAVIDTSTVATNRSLRMAVRRPQP
jgi:hypothetical protein